MGSTARKLDSDEARRARPLHLRVVKSKAGAQRRPACSQEAKARQTFLTFALLASVVATLGVGRVWMSVQAAQASVDASRLRQQIKVERYVGDMLEVQQSALGSPSRIRAIAGATMDMGRAADVTYIDLKPAAVRSASAGRSSTVAARQRESGVDRLLSEVLGLAAGEAQVLLVGDVGLASAR